MPARILHRPTLSSELVMAPAAEETDLRLLQGAATRALPPSQARSRPHHSWWWSAGRATRSCFLPQPAPSNLDSPIVAPSCCSAVDGEDFHSNDGDATTELAVMSRPRLQFLSVLGRRLVVVSDGASTSILELPAYSLTASPRASSVLLMLGWSWPSRLACCGSLSCPGFHYLLDSCWRATTASLPWSGL